METPIDIEATLLIEQSLILSFTVSLILSLTLSLILSLILYMYYP